ncbi:unnamed protein product [Paramecium octaurelia]|uniref:Transmembrane protein n=1 Tax=Paramecium octaurelia TaxID=43137 RepID=A0A8S1T588_PAROT|nr:unnamed protein product [Paramecium octaurelia]
MILFCRCIPIIVKSEIFQILNFYKILCYEVGKLNKYIKKIDVGFIDILSFFFIIITLFNVYEMNQQSDLLCTQESRIFYGLTGITIIFVFLNKSQTTKIQLTFKNENFILYKQQNQIFKM